VIATRLRAVSREWEEGRGGSDDRVWKLPIFIEYLKQGGVVRSLGVAGGPLSMTSPKRAVEAGPTGTS